MPPLFSARSEEKTDKAAAQGQHFLPMFALLGPKVTRQLNGKTQIGAALLGSRAQGRSLLQYSLHLALPSEIDGRDGFLNKYRCSLFRNSLHHNFIQCRCNDFCFLSNRCSEFPRLPPVFGEGRAPAAESDIGAQPSMGRPERVPPSSETTYIRLTMYCFGLISLVAPWIAVSKLK